MASRPLSIGGTSSSRAGNGQTGCVCVGTMRVSTCTPTVSVTLRASTCGCAAAARTGRISSHRLGRPVLPPPSGMARHILVHCSRAVRSIIGSLRSRACRLAICALTSRSIKGLASLAMLIFTPASVSALSPSATWAVRLGSRRQFAVSAGLECTVTWPRSSARWSSTLLVRLPTALPILLSSRPVMPPVRLPAAPAICPVIFRLPLMGVVMINSLGVPLTAMVPRATVMPISALDSRLETGLSFLPTRSRGAAASMLARMAVSATATGAITYDARVTGCSAGSAGRLATARLASLFSTGKKWSSVHKVAAKKMATMQTAPRASRKLREPANRRSGAVAA